jgi:hypothetical protein
LAGSLKAAPNASGPGGRSGADRVARARARTESRPRALSEAETPRLQMYRIYTGQMDTGSCLDFAVAYQDIIATKGMPRDSH